MARHQSSPGSQALVIQELIKIHESSRMDKACSIQDPRRNEGKSPTGTITVRLTNFCLTRRHLEDTSGLELAPGGIGSQMRKRMKISKPFSNENESDEEREASQILESLASFKIADNKRGAMPVPNRKSHKLNESRQLHTPVFSRARQAATPN